MIVHFINYIIHYSYFVMNSKTILTEILDNFLKRYAKSLSLSVIWEI